MVAIAHEELLMRKKYDSSFPAQAIKFCLDYTGVMINRGLMIY